MSDGSLNPARPLCRTKTNEERLRESIAAATAANEELNVVIAQHSALLANANGELHVLLDQDEHSASDLESIEALKMSVQSRIATFNAMLATQRATIATAESEALSKKQQALQAMTSGDSVAAQRLNNEGARLSLSLSLSHSASRRKRTYLVNSVHPSPFFHTTLATSCRGGAFSRRRRSPHPDILRLPGDVRSPAHCSSHPHWSDQRGARRRSRR